ncbi:MAG: DUF2950 domain-containing protein [Deltaproteobacteria bacterium]|nr:DUF2950 domain-containing protein [Deltaproteobacteria bacterium]
MAAWSYPYTLTVLMVIVALYTVGFSTAVAAVEQKAFISPQEAVKALVAAVQDNNDAELIAIFGPDSEDLIFSGDRVADQKSKERFLSVYEEKNSLKYESDVKAVLYIGSGDYAFPIPIVQEENAWFFDIQEGKEEILCRRIGRSELHTIEVLYAYTDAQREYVAIDHSSCGCPEFAQRLTSTKGKKDGLYWEAKEGEEESPFGPLIAKATEILKAQGKHANGGAFDYVVKDKMILGFALVAYPAKYGASGIMTFIVNQEDEIYEKDLGKDTANKATAMTTFDPDSTWKKYEEDTGQ